MGENVQLLTGHRAPRHQRPYHQKHAAQQWRRRPQRQLPPHRINIFYYHFNTLLEIDAKYWDNIFRTEGITDNRKQKLRIVVINKIDDSKECDDCETNIQ